MLITVPIENKKSKSNSDKSNQMQNISTMPDFITARQEDVLPARGSTNFDFDILSNIGFFYESEKNGP